METRSEDRRIRALRPRKRPVDPWRPLDVLVEEERTREGTLEPSVTVFLAGSECPFTCVFCDLWRDTLDEPTPRGALPAQLDRALERVGPQPPGAGIKLYNASNFFEPRAVPPEDLPAIAERLGGFARVTVECHPRLVGESCREFAARLDDRLEVAMGLETAHPEALARLNKKMTLEDFDRAAERLGEWGIGLRVFVLVGVPFVAGDETVEWSVRSAAHAFDRGAGVVSLIPVRRSAGEMQRLEESGEFLPPTLDRLERALDGALALGRGVVLVDLWDVERFVGCAECAAARIERLKRINRTGTAEEPVTCAVCGAGGRS